MQILAWVALIGTMMLVGSTFAWYSMVKKEADSEQVNVMEPYYLTLLNPSETAVLQLSVGSLMPGKTKQIVFCVSNHNNEEKINMGGSDFDYFMELIYTNNLKLNYSIYELEAADETNGAIVAEDTITAEDGTVMTTISYWNKKSDSTPLSGTEISSMRHVETELAGDTGEDITDIINRGTYVEYDKGVDGTNFHLSVGTDATGYDSQYFLMEIRWDEAAQGSFDKYEKETDMIYLVVKALQPEPVK